jgi:TonB family protein
LATHVSNLLETFCSNRQCMARLILTVAVGSVVTLAIASLARAQDAMPAPPSIVSEAPLALQGALDAGSSLVSSDMLARGKAARNAEFAQRQQLAGARDHYLTSARDAVGKTRAAVLAARGFGEKILDVPSAVGRPAWDSIAAARALALYHTDDVAMDTLRAMLQVPQRCVLEFLLAQTKATFGQTHKADPTCGFETVRRNALAEIDRVEAVLGGAAPVTTVTPAARPGVKTISGGMLNGKATTLPSPVYPAAAKAARAEGSVVVFITVDENGNVSAASASSGHPLLRKAAEDAALKATFPPAQAGGAPVKVSGMLTFSFVLPATPN